MFTVRVRRIGENHVCLRGSAPRCQRIRGVISRALEQDNAQLENRDQVTIDSIRNHTARHFPVQQVARATYREILERRAKKTASTSSRVWPPPAHHWPSLRPSW
jgi:hypothetical protein